MVLAADYPFLDVFWTMILFFFWVAWIWMLIAIFSDVFRRRHLRLVESRLVRFSSSCCRSSARSST